VRKLSVLGQYTSVCSLVMLFAGDNAGQVPDKAVFATHSCKSRELDMQQLKATDLVLMDTCTLGIYWKLAYKSCSKN